MRESALGVNTVQPLVAVPGVTLSITSRVSSVAPLEASWKLAEDQYSPGASVPVALSLIVTVTSTEALCASCPEAGAAVTQGSAPLASQLSVPLPVFVSVYTANGGVKGPAAGPVALRSACGARLMVTPAAEIDRSQSIATSAWPPPWSWNVSMPWLVPAGSAAAIAPFSVACTL